MRHVVPDTVKVMSTDPGLDCFPPACVTAGKSLSFSRPLITPWCSKTAFLMGLLGGLNKRICANQARGKCCGRTLALFTCTCLFMSIRFRGVGRAPLWCAVCARVHTCCVCHPRTGPPSPVKCRSACLCVENLTHVSSSPESHLSHHPSPLRFLLLPCKQPAVVSCHLGSQIHVFAPDGVGRGLTDTINLIPPMETDLEPRASKRCPPSLVRQKLPLEPPLPWAEPDPKRRKGMFKSGSWGGVSGGAAGS